MENFDIFRLRLQFNIIIVAEKNNWTDPLYDDKSFRRWKETVLITDRLIFSDQKNVNVLYYQQERFR